MVRLLIAHHLSIVADLESSERKRKEAFTTIELAIEVFKKVALAWTTRKIRAYPTKQRVRAQQLARRESVGHTTDRREMCEKQREVAAFT